MGQEGASRVEGAGRAVAARPPAPPATHLNRERRARKTRNPPTPRTTRTGRATRTGCWWCPGPQTPRSSRAATCLAPSCCGTRKTGSCWAAAAATKSGSRPWCARGRLSLLLLRSTPPLPPPSTRASAPPRSARPPPPPARPPGVGARARRAAQPAVCERQQGHDRARVGRGDAQVPLQHEQPHHGVLTKRRPPRRQPPRAPAAARRAARCAPPPGRKAPSPGAGPRLLRPPPPNMPAPGRRLGLCPRLTRPAAARAPLHPPQVITAVKWGGEGLIYSASRDTTINVWDARDGKLVRGLLLFEFRIRVRSTRSTAELGSRAAGRCSMTGGAHTQPLTYARVSTHAHMPPFPPKAARPRGPRPLGKHPGTQKRTCTQTCAHPLVTNTRAPPLLHIALRCAASKATRTGSTPWRSAASTRYARVRTTTEGRHPATQRKQRRWVDGTPGRELRFSGVGYSAPVLEGGGRQSRARAPSDPEEAKAVGGCITCTNVFSGAPLSQEGGGGGGGVGPAPRPCAPLSGDAFVTCACTRTRALTRSHPLPGPTHRSVSHPRRRASGMTRRRAASPSASSAAATTSPCFCGSRPPARRTSRG